MNCKSFAESNKGNKASKEVSMGLIFVQREFLGDKEREYGSTPPPYYHGYNFLWVVKILTQGLQAAAAGSLQALSSDTPDNQDRKFIQMCLHTVLGMPQP